MLKIYEEIQSWHSINVNHMQEEAVDILSLHNFDPVSQSGKNVSCRWLAGLYLSSLEDLPKYFCMWSPELRLSDASQSARVTVQEEDDAETQNALKSGQSQRYPPLFSSLIRPCRARNQEAKGHSGMVRLARTDTALDRVVTTCCSSLLYWNQNFPKADGASLRKEHYLLSGNVWSKKLLWKYITSPDWVVLQG